MFTYSIQSKLRSAPGPHQGFSEVAWLQCDSIDLTGGAGQSRDPRTTAEIFGKLSKISTARKHKWRLCFSKWVRFNAFQARVAAGGRLASMPGRCGRVELHWKAMLENMLENISATYVFERSVSKPSTSAGWRGSDAGQVARPGGFDARQVRRNFRQLSPHRTTGFFFPGKNPDLGAGSAGLRCRAGGAAGRLLCQAGGVGARSFFGPL